MQKRVPILDDSYGLDADFSNVASDAQLTGLSNVANLASAQATSDGEIEAVSDTNDSVGAYLDTSEIGGVASIGGQSTTNGGAQAVNVSGYALADESTYQSTGLWADQIKVDARCHHPRHRWRNF